MSIYLDHNATTPVRPEAADAVASGLALVGNPSSVHGPGREAKRALEEARERVARLVGARPTEITFTSGGTEANNLALSCTGAAPVLASAIEHPSVLNAARPLRPIPATGAGVVDVAALAGMLGAAGEEAPAGLVSVMAANNETGVLQPIEAVVALGRDAGVPVHVDAVQAAGKVPLDVAALGADLLSLSAHKIGGPPGVGALYVREGVKLPGMLKGGGQERGKRAGTEALALIMGFGRAAELVMEGLGAQARLEKLRDGFEAWVKDIAPRARIFGAEAQRLPNTTCLTMPGVDSETQVMAFDLAGFAVSAGSACSSGKVEPSHVLAAMGVAEDEARSALRVTLGWTSKENDLESFKTAWKDLYDRLGIGPVAA